MAMSIAKRARHTRPLTLDPAGFTLLEVMVAVAVIAIALIPLLRLHLLSLDATLYAQDLTTAVGLAQKLMAEMPFEPDPGDRHGTFDEAIYQRFRWQTSVGESEEIPLPNLDALDALSSNAASANTANTEEQTTLNVQHIEVTVLWMDGKREKLYTLESYAVH
jgi:general secretion pathway protein I